jgi:putative transposase
MIATAIRTIFAQPKADMVHDQLDVIAGMLGRQSTKVESMLRGASDDLLAFTGFPPQSLEEDPSRATEQRDQMPHRRGGVFPNPEALLRLAGAVLVEAHGQWHTTDRRYLTFHQRPAKSRPGPRLGCVRTGHTLRRTNSIW